MTTFRSSDTSTGSTDTSTGSTASWSSRRDTTADAPTRFQPSTPDEFGDTAEAAGSQVRSAAASLGSDVREAAKTATRAVKEQASEFAADVGHELGKSAEEQKMRGVEAMKGFARAIDTAAAELEGQSPRVAQYVREAAQKVEGLSGNISGRNVSELMQAASDLARSQPVLFLGGAVAAGFALSRFFKSSAMKQDVGPRSGNPAES